MFGAWPITFGPALINLSTILLALLVLVFAIIVRLRLRRTQLFEVSFLLFLAGFLFLNFHGRLLQLIFPISLPEKPLADNNLTFNYALTNLLTYVVFPSLTLALLKSDISLGKVGLKILNLRQTLFYTSLGLVFAISLFGFSSTFFGFRWISEYTFDGLILWVLLVTILSIFTQTFFYVGILFNKYLSQENRFLLTLISVAACQTFAYPLSLPWVVMNIVGSTAKIVVTYRTRNIYGATLMGIIPNLIDVVIQIL